MPNQADWDFIAYEEEGPSPPSTEGYVPKNKDGIVLGKSGVTVSIGFDIGQRDLNDLKKYNLPAELHQKLVPYLNLRKEKAANYLRDHPLKLTREEAQLIWERIKQIEGQRILRRYDYITGQKSEKLPSNYLTVLSSVGYQYGTQSSMFSELSKAMASFDQKNIISILESDTTYRSRRRNEIKLILDPNFKNYGVKNKALKQDSPYSLSKNSNSQYGPKSPSLDSLSSPLKNSDYRPKSPSLDSFSSPFKNSHDRPKSPSLDRFSSPFKKTQMNPISRANLQNFFPESEPLSYKLDSLIKNNIFQKSPSLDSFSNPFKINPIRESTLQNFFPVTEAFSHYKSDSKIENNIFSSRKLVRKGDRGDEVKSLQQGLIAKGYLNGNADGILGPITERALKEFQRRNGLNDDGIFGPKTKEKLNWH